MDPDGPQRAVGGLSVRPPPGVELRPPGRAEVGSVLRLLAAREAVPAPDIDLATAQHRWNVALNDVDSAPFLASAGDEAVGLLLLSFRRRLNFATWEAWVPELVVAPGARRRGIGRALLRVAIEEWRLRGGHRLAVELAEGEDAGRALVEALGLQEAFLRFAAPLGDAMEATEGTRVPGVEVRPVTLDDFDGVTRLIAEMGPHRSPVPDRMDAVERAFREIVGRPGQVSLVAVSDGTTVGICTVELRESLRLPQPVAWIPELVVTEPFRGRGIGRALLTAALAAAADRGAGSAMLESGAARTTAHALYRSIGFERAGSVHTLLRDR